MDVRHIYWFSFFDMSEPGIRYRAKYALDALRENNGISYSLITTGYDVHSVSYFIKTYLSALLFRKKNSIIVFQKTRSKRIYANALKVLLFFRKEHTLYDLDDPDYLSFSVKTIHYFIKNCSACSLGSQALIEYVTPLNKNNFLLTSPVIEHNEIKQQRNTTLTIGWIGYYDAHQNSLKTLLFPALLNLDFNVKLVLLGVTKEQDRIDILQYFAKNKNIEPNMPGDIDWLNEFDIYQRIKQFDIGISPLLDNEINRAKSAFKLKQCLSCGIPVLASCVGENARFLQNGINGYFCNNAEEYTQAIISINALACDDYKTLCTNARNSVSNFSIQKYCTELLDFYKNKKH